MRVFYYALAAFIFGIMLTLGAVFLAEEHKSPDKNCFIFEPVQRTENYEKSDIQRWLGATFITLGLGILPTLSIAYDYAKNENKQTIKNV